jgi:hypothetical protein
LCFNPAMIYMKCLDIPYAVISHGPWTHPQFQSTSCRVDLAELDSAWSRVMGEAINSMSDFERRIKKKLLTSHSLSFALSANEVAFGEPFALEVELTAWPYGLCRCTVASGAIAVLATGHSSNHVSLLVNIASTIVEYFQQLIVGGENGALVGIYALQGAPRNMINIAQRVEEAFVSKKAGIICRTTYARFGTRVAQC